MMQLTIRQWPRANGYDPAQAGLSVEIAGTQIPRNLWNETFVGPDADIDRIINT